MELYNNKTEFSTPLHKSYRCAKEQTFDLMKIGSNKTCGVVTLSHVQLEAFHEKKDGLFDTGLYCVMHVTMFVYSVYSLILCTTTTAFTHILFCLFTIMFSNENLEVGVFYQVLGSI